MTGRYSRDILDPACRAMYRAAIELAIADGDDELILAEDGEHRAHFDWLCDQAGMEPEAVRQAYRARGHQKYALSLKDWAFLSYLRVGVPKTTAAKQAGYKSKATADKLLNRRDIVRVFQRYPHDFGEVSKLDAQ